MVPVTFAFIRHGQTDWNRDDKLQGSSDIPLNAQGREQAHEAAGILADGGWEVVVSSPLQRARETAKIIAHDLGLELGRATRRWSSATTDRWKGNPRARPSRAGRTATTRGPRASTPW